MAEALGWGFRDDPAMTLTTGGANTGGPDAMLAGGAGGRAAYRDAAEGRGQRHWVLGFPRLADGQDSVELDGVEYRARDLFPDSGPAPTVTEKARSWQRWAVVTGQQTADGTERYERSVQLPAPTVTGNTDRWRLQPGRYAHPGHPTGHRRQYDPEVEPAPTVAFGHDAANWCWVRPSTALLGDSRVSPPNRWGGAPQGARPKTTSEVLAGEYDDPLAAIRLTIDEAAVLQSFPGNYPWTGTSSSKFKQCGNAYPPVMAAFTLQAVTGGP